MNQKGSASPAWRRFSATNDSLCKTRSCSALTVEMCAGLLPLQDYLKQKGFSKTCMEEVQRYQQESVQDIRLNHRLFRACKEDVGAVCAEACDFKQGEVEMCSGKVRQQGSAVQL